MPARVALALVVVVVAAPVARADSPGSPGIHEGYNLLEVRSGTTVDDIPFTGVPLGSHDFGQLPVWDHDLVAVGTRATGNASALLGHGATWYSGYTGALELTYAWFERLTLVSAQPVDVPGGAELLYLTLTDTPNGKLYDGGS